MTLLEFILQGGLLGLSAGLLPGPFQGYLINTTLTQGWRRSILVIFAPLLTDGPIIVLMVVLLKQLPPEVIRAIQLVGGVYLLWIAYGAWRQFRANVTIGAAESVPTGRSTLLKSMMMNWLSPGPYIFWGTITGPLLVQALSQSVWHGAAFMLAFYGVFLGVLAALVVVFDLMRRLDPRVTRLLMLATIGVLVYFALQLIFGIG
ncbi:MAG: LysE family transporter [Anaerolineaceae bacterium]|nr:LysE family transporter [Anaerolineaceae bacterium]